MNRRSFLGTGASALAWAALTKTGHAQMFRGQVPDGPLDPDWESLKAYRCLDWYRDAKLGIRRRCNRDFQRRFSSDGGSP